MRKKEIVLQIHTFFGTEGVFKYTVTTPEAYIALQGIFYTDRLVVIIVLTNEL
jgi:hypothetical protein